MTSNTTGTDEIFWRFVCHHFYERVSPLGISASLRHPRDLATIAACAFRALHTPTQANIVEAGRLCDISGNSGFLSIVNILLCAPAV